MVAQDCLVSLESVSSNPSARRRRVAQNKVSFDSFVSNLWSEKPGNRSFAKHAASKGSTKFSRSARRIKFSFLASIASISLLAVLAVLAVQLNSSSLKTQLVAPTQQNFDEPDCDFKFSETDLDSRTRASFGGVRVESGLVSCDGDTYIITQTSTDEGEVESEKKKRA
jgi:hypothetical protein